MKKKIINAACCDAREVTEESLAAYEDITINTAVLIVGKRSRELLNKYPITVNAGTVLEIPDDRDLTVKSVNGKGEIGPNADGAGAFLLVNGKLFIADGSTEAVKSYFRIFVNGKVLMPKSCKGQFQNLQINGKTEFYPDGATILKPDTQIDGLFLARATNTIYYCSGNLFFLDAGIDTEKMAAEGLRFSAKKIVIAESLIGKLISRFDEETEVIKVPDGARFIDGDLELLPRTIRKYGTKLCVNGDVSIRDAEALSALEYLFADGTVSVDKDLADAFDAVESVYDELRIKDPAMGCFTDRPLVRVSAALLEKYPNGVQIEDCARVTISADLRAEDVAEKLRITDCAMVICTKEQEAAVNLIAEDVARIKTTERDPEAEGTNDETIDPSFDKPKDKQVINATAYKM